MRKTKLFLFLALATLFVMPSCEDDGQIHANFSTEYDDYEVGETIFFDNHSTHFDDCYWDFDDGYYSDRFNPEHYYTEAGTYRVKLKVYNDDDSDQCVKTIHVHGN